MHKKMLKRIVTPQWTMKYNNIVVKSGRYGNARTSSGYKASCRNYRDEAHE